MSDKKEIKVGQFLFDHEIITSEQLNEALEMQKDNPARVLGQILVTLGYLTREDLIMAMEMYMIETGAEPEVIDEWLDQDEIDTLLEKIAK